jgi:hypothetical protein
MFSGRRRTKRPGPTSSGPPKKRKCSICKQEGSTVLFKFIVFLKIFTEWNMKYFVIPVIIGATGIVSKGLKNIWKQYQDNIQ